MNQFAPEGEGRTKARTHSMIKVQFCMTASIMSIPGIPRSLCFSKPLFNPQLGSGHFPRRAWDSSEKTLDLYPHFGVAASSKPLARAEYNPKAPTSAQFHRHEIAHPIRHCSFMTSEISQQTHGFDTCHAFFNPRVPHDCLLATPLPDETGTIAGQGLSS